MAMLSSSSSSSSFAVPQPGASLLVALNPPSCTDLPARRSILIVGQHRLAAARCFAALEAGFNVILAIQRRLYIDAELDARLAANEIQSIDLPEDFKEDWLQWFESLPTSILDDIQLVCVTDTLASSSSSTSQKPRTRQSALSIRKACYRLRIPINVADNPALSDFHFPATHRFPLLSPSLSNASSAASPLQIAITTNANSCRLASRIRREIIAKLPKGIGSAVAKVGQLRELAKEVDRNQQSNVDEELEQGEREEGWSSTLLNKPVPQILAPPSGFARSKCTAPARRIVFDKPLFSAPLLTPPATPPATSCFVDKMEQILAGEAPRPVQVALTSVTRMRFIAQISEYWPIERLANMSQEEASRVISLYSKSLSAEQQNCSAQSHSTPTSTAESGESSQPDRTQDVSQLPNDTASRHALALGRPLATPQKRGRIYLLGSGPGSPALLTMAAHSLLTQHATLILSDKLVPPQILALIPKHIPLTIAKKFPGNAEGAQNELMDLAYEGAQRGETVVRLKQGDPYVYGRGGEEVLFFRERGYEAVVVPGISSAFAAPLMAGIPVTQRGVSESVVVCTGVGRKGKGVKLPGYERARTTVVLMGVARLSGVIQALTSNEGQEGHGREGGARDGAAYPPYCPIAIIERASSPDQRMVASTLEGIVDALDRAGEQRPPGMMIIGWSALALEGKGDVEILDGTDGRSPEDLERVDRERVTRWLGPKGYICREGLVDNWTEFLDREEPARSLEEIAVE